MKTLALLASLAAGSAAAQTPLTATEFEDYVTGRTLTYSAGGAPYGVEEYRPDRRVRWSYLDETCREGHWYPAGERICFEYSGGIAPQCWTFFLEGGRLTARFGDDPPGSELYETRATDEPLYCPGPDAGV